MTFKPLIRPSIRPSIRAMALATAVLVAPLAPLPGLVAAAEAQVALSSFAPLVKATKPSVVTVMVKGSAPQAMMREGRPGPLPGPMEDFMRRFGQEFEQPRPRPQEGLGSGFIVDANGTIVTNNHVVAGADEITVQLDDGTELAATLLGRDEKTDLAVLKVDAGKPLPAIAWGDSDALEVGDWAVAIGNPFGLGGTVTSGIVSARGRDIGSGPYDDFIQVDVAINRGNSGGPLLALDGAVVGVNTALFSPNGGNIGLGFAIPSNQAKRIVADLIDDGAVDRGWIGVRIQPVTPDIAGSLGLKDASGALIAEVLADSPAMASGLRAGDVITGFADRPVTTPGDLTTAVADALAGNEAALTIWRNGATQTLSITPERLETAALEGNGPAGARAIPALGLDVRPLADDADAPQGVLVSGVEPGGPAAAAGLRVGDIIQSANQRPTPDVQALDAAVGAAVADGRAAILVQVSRDGASRFVTVGTPDA